MHGTARRPRRTDRDPFVGFLAGLPGIGGGMPLTVNADELPLQTDCCRPVGAGEQALSTAVAQL